MGAMHLGFESRDDGGETLAAFYAERARGGAGLIVTGGWAVNRAAAAGRSYGLVNEDDAAPRLRRVADAVHAAGGRIALQLFHAGRYAPRASFDIQAVAPSPLASTLTREEPRAMTEEDIWETIALYARGAFRALQFGFDGVEIMASEGYLVDQFLSPLTNRRDDDWGGDAARRRRFGMEILRAIRRMLGPDIPVIFRISGVDLMPGGTPQDDVLDFARALAHEGVDAINVGVGWHESRVPTVQSLVPAGVWIRYAAAIKEVVGGVPVIGGNRINTLTLADEILARGSVDFISMARPFLADPALVSKAAGGQAQLIDTCIACNQACIDRSLSDGAVSCMVNPRAGRELELREDRPAGKALHVAVIGGGPAGMEAARALAALGHRVELFEAQVQLGGQLRLAARVPGKGDYGETIRYFTHELARLGVRVRLSECFGAADVERLRAYDATIVATGVRPRAIDLPGADLPHVRTYAQALLGEQEIGRRVAIVGAGGIAVDVAHLLAYGDAELDSATRFLWEQGLWNGGVDGALVIDRRRVAMLRRGTRVGEHIGKSTRWAILQELRRQGVETLTGVSYERIVPEGLWIRDERGERRLIEADNVVIAAGQVPENALAAALARASIRHRVIGGAREAKELDAVRAFDEGARAAHELGERPVAALPQP
ncbi:2,4-dienoyl-CoA reductase [bacterium]|nr:MAG: 2,4-dienoyl-CoA reductase [bacterium]